MLIAWLPTVIIVSVNDVPLTISRTAQDVRSQRALQNISVVVVKFPSVTTAVSVVIPARIPFVSAVNIFVIVVKRPDGIPNVLMVE